MFLTATFQEKLRGKLARLGAACLPPTAAETRERFGPDALQEVACAARDPRRLGDLEDLLRTRGAEVTERFPGLGVLLAHLPVDRVLTLDGSPLGGLADPEAEVRFPVLEEAGDVQPALDRSVPRITTYRGVRLPPHLPGSGTPWDGRGVRVAVLDTGIDDGHPALAGRVVLHRNFSGDADAADHQGHGTHCAGIAASADATWRGVAPGASLLNLKVLDRRGSGSYSSVLRGMQAALDERADIVSMSLGGSGHCRGTCPLCQAAAAMRARGLLVVVAAGNSGRQGAGTIDCPGASPGALTVGAVDVEGRLADFSGRGPTADGRVKPDLVAPGVAISSARPGGGFVRYSGTSMATPHVAGAAALLLQFQRARSTGAVGEADLRRGLERAEALDYPPNQGGHGLVNLVRAAGLEGHAASRSLVARLGLGEPYRCANHPDRDLWAGWPARVGRCARCGGALCPACARRSEHCSPCRRT